MKASLKLTKNMIVLIIVVVIIVSAVLVVLFKGRGEIEKIYLSSPVQQDFDADNVNDGVSFSIFAVAPGVQKASGGGIYKIYYSNDTLPVYSSSFSFIKGRDTADIAVRYERFVKGNGDYRIEVESKGKKATETFTIGFVVEAVNVSVSIIYTDQGYKAQTVVIPTDSKGSNLLNTPIKSSVEFTFKDPKGNPQICTVEKNSFPSGVYISHNFNLTERGNYTLRVDWRNRAVMQESPLSDVVSTGRYYLDKPPLAVLNVPSHVSLGGHLSKTVELDGSGSTDDGEIIIYTFSISGPKTWSYTEAKADSSDGVDNDNDGKVDEPDEAEDGIFDGKTTYEFTTPGKYTITLYIQDNNPVIPGSNSTSVLVDVTIV